MFTANPASIISLSIVAVVVAFTGYAIYIAFGPPSKELADPFEDHED
ncbi:photosystem II reaction center protein PsbN [Lyngbya confervoides]|uniref:Protein PsbN n=1 Tax=Lyngbya confervoides BDU141951 TaxID=1574623 RepID=A0ABD4T3B1_9CYAN|nr:photosystem II reaction center protein PsbN [Lyngbya confervoides]MCM1982737.1 photosystem II reaction center protein PsbN [Lyngbya confervoides BDU141951]